MFSWPMTSYLISSTARHFVIDNIRSITWIIDIDLDTVLEFVANTKHCVTVDQNTNRKAVTCRSIFFKVLVSSDVFQEA